MKRKILILITTIIAALLCITACTGGDQAKITSIDVVAGSIPTQLKVGETPDFSGIKVKVNYSDNTTKEVGYADVVISSVDTSTAGTKTITVTYKDVSTTVQLTVSDTAAVAAVTAIKIVPGTVDLAYYIGQTPDMSRLQVEATFSDGTVGVLPEGEYTYTTIDTSVSGDQTFTVTYTANVELTDSITVSVVDISSMQVVSGSVPSKILVGETLDTSGLEVLVQYANGESEIVGFAGLTVGTIDSSSYGKKELSITYKDMTIKITIEVVGPVSLTVNKGSYAESVKVFGTFDASTLTAYVTYSDETAKALTAADLTIGTIDTTSAGKQSLKVTYGTLETEVEITVVGVESLTVVDNTVKAEILKGSALDTSTISVSVTYTDGTTELVGADALTLGTVDTNAGGDQILTVAFLNKTVNYTVKVCEITKIRVEGIVKTVPSGEPIDISAMKVYGIYNDKNETELLLTDGISTNLADLDINSEDDKTLTVSYNGDYGQFSANVIISTTPPELDSLTITTWDKVIGLGGVYDTNSINVYVNYGNSTSEKTTNFTVTAIDTSVAGDITVTVSYTEDGQTVSESITVKVLPITSMQVSGIASSVYKNGILDTTGVKVLVTFSDGTNTLTREVGADKVTVSTPDTTTGGDKKLTVGYLGSSVEVAYHVIYVTKIDIFGGVDNELRRGYAVDYSALVLNITYSNDHTVQKSASELTGVSYEGTDAGSTEFGVTYEGCKATLALTVINVVRIDALNNTVPAVVQQGQIFSYDSIRLSVYYDNGDVYLVKLGKQGAINVKADPQIFNTTTSGTKAITFTYSDGSGTTFTATVNVLVKGVKTVEIVGGVLNMVTVGHELDTSEILVKVSYDDGTYVYIGRSNPNLVVHSIDTSKVGDVTLVVEVYGVKGTMTVTVKEAATLDGIILGALLPDELVARESYKKNFKDSTSAYRVGDDNPYYFYLNVIQLDENDNLKEIDGKTVPTAAKVFLVENGVETELVGDALTAMVNFTSSLNSYDFTEAAIGKTFRLEICPANSASYVDAASVTKSHTVTVVDGYNIYHARELNIITNVHDNLNDSVFGDENSIDQVVAVTKFLARHGITRPENLAGIVLHCNLDVQVEDIPPEYLYEYTDKNGNKKTELLEQVGIFNLGLTPNNKTFSIYGNYYSIYSYNIPCVVPKGVANNDDDFSSSQLFKLKLMYSTIADANGYTDVAYPQIHDSIANGNEKPFENYVVNVMDIATRDNDPNSNDQTASERHMRGLLCYKVGENVSNFTNVNVEAYMISLCVEHANSTLNLDKVNFYNAWQGHLFLWNDNRYQSWMIGEDVDTLPYMQDVVVNIKDSSLTKCGGPVILAQNAGMEENCNRGVGIDVRVDDKSDLHTYVTGQEAWFVAVGQTQLAAQIRAMSKLVELGGGHGYTANDKIQGVETINMVMVSMGSGMTLNGSETYNGSFVKTEANGDKSTGLMMSRPDNNRGTYKNYMLDLYNNATSQITGGAPAPVFQSSGGGTAYTDGATGCYGIETGGPGAPLPNFYQGEYITLYYMGVGIMLEYYHP